MHRFGRLYRVIGRLAATQLIAVPVVVLLLLLSLTQTPIAATIVLVLFFGCMLSMRLAMVDWLFSRRAAVFRWLQLLWVVIMGYLVLKLTGAIQPPAVMSLLLLIVAGLYAGTVFWYFSDRRYGLNLVHVQSQPARYGDQVEALHEEER